MKSAYKLDSGCYNNNDKKNFFSYHSKLYGMYHDYNILESEKKLVSWEFHIVDKREASLIEKRFNELANKWKKETGMYSTMFDKINDTYLEIISLGTEIIPFILNDIRKVGGTSHWHTALKTLAKESPVATEELNKSKIVKEKWLEWGKKKNII